jgi:hypothetical protein
MKPQEVGVILLVAAEAPQAYSAFLPSIMTIRTFVGDPGAVEDIRQGELFGSIFVGLIAVAGSYLTESPWPIIIGIVTIISMVAVYEYALQTGRGDYNMKAGANGHTDDGE